MPASLIIKPIEPKTKLSYANPNQMTKQNIELVNVFEEFENTMETNYSDEKTNRIQDEILEHVTGLPRYKLMGIYNLNNEHDHIPDDRITTLSAGVYENGEDDFKNALSLQLDGKNDTILLTDKREFRIRGIRITGS